MEKCKAWCTDTHWCKFCVAKLEEEIVHLKFELYQKDVNIKDLRNIVDLYKYVRNKNKTDGLPSVF
mgnify:CR=1 FL=1